MLLHMSRYVIIKVSMSVMSVAFRTRTHAHTTVVVDNDTSEQASDSCSDV